MKKILMILSLVAISEMALAQHSTGDMNLNVGLGLLSNLKTGDTAVPPVGASFEYGIKDEISVGGYLGFTSSEFFNNKYSYTIIGLRGSYHYDLLGNPKIDTYGGVMLGYYILSVDNSAVTTANSVYYGGFIGGRYAFSDNMGAFAEIGYGVSILQLGANLKF
ncbi:MAG: outer membrane beta-barrel protein [Cyclobacteriaceae bacterium]